MLRDYLGWPGARQVFQVMRERQLPGGRLEQEVVYGVTSLGPGQADARRLLGLNRGHWGIENGLHGVRDVAFGEDGWRVRSGSAPQALAATRNALVRLLHELGPGSLAGALRRFAARPLEALALLLRPPKH